MGFNIVLEQPQARFVLSLDLSCCQFLSEPERPASLSAFQDFLPGSPSNAWGTFPVFCLRPHHSQAKSVPEDTCEGLWDLSSSAHLLLHGCDALCYLAHVNSHVSCTCWLSILFCVLIIYFLVVLGLHCCSGFALGAATGGLSLVSVTGFSLLWLPFLVQSMGSKACRLQRVWHVGLVAASRL